MSKTVFSPFPSNTHGEIDDADCKPDSLIHGIVVAMLKNYGTGIVKSGYGRGMGFSKNCDQGNWMALLVRFRIAIIMLAIMLLVGLLSLYYLIALIMKGCCLPNSCERPFQRIARLILTVLAFILLLPLLYGIMVALTSSLLLVSLKGGSEMYLSQWINGVCKQIEHVYVKNYEEFATGYVREASSILRQYQMKQKPKSLPSFNDPTGTLLSAIHQVHADSYEMRDQFSMLIDYLRFFNRNASVYLMWHPTGMRVIEEAGLGGLARRTLKYSDLQILDLNVVAMDDLVNRMTKRSLYVRTIPETVGNEAAAASRKLIISLKKFLIRYGKDLRAQGSLVVDDVQSSFNEIHKTNKFQLPQNVWMYGYIYVLLVIVLVVLIVVGLVLGTFGERKPNAPWGFNKASGGRILIIVIVILLILFPFMLRIFLQHFFYGVVTHNLICNVNYIETQSKASAPATIFHTCKDHETVFRVMLRLGLTSEPELKNADMVNRMVDNALNKVKNVKVKNVPRSFSPDEIRHVAHRASGFNHGDVCRAIKRQIHLDYLKNAADHVTNYLKENRLRSMSDKVMPWGVHIADRANCTVEFFQKRVLNDHIEGKMMPMANKIERMCTQILNYFPKGVDNDTGEYLTDLDKVFKFYRSAFRDNSDSVNNLLKEAYKTHVNGYMKHIVDALENKIGKCGFVSSGFERLAFQQCSCISHPINGVWVGGFIIILTLLPLIPALMYLANLFRKVCVDYEKREKRPPKHPRSMPEPRPKVVRKDIIEAQEAKQALAQAVAALRASVVHEQLQAPSAQPEEVDVSEDPRTSMAVPVPSHVCECRKPKPPRPVEPISDTGFIAMFKCFKKK